MMPTTWEGKICSTGNRNPVRLVKTMVTRKIAVQPSSRFPVRNPNMTANPEPISARLINTCRKVYVAPDMPRIMMRLLPETRLTSPEPIPNRPPKKTNFWRFVPRPSTKTLGRGLCLLTNLSHLSEVI